MCSRAMAWTTSISRRYLQFDIMKSKHINLKQMYQPVDMGLGQGSRVRVSPRRSETTRDMGSGARAWVRGLELISR